LRALIFLFFILFICSGFFGQSKKLDSLIKDFHAKYSGRNNSDAREDTVFINYAHQLADEYLGINDLFGALKYSKIEGQFYEKIKDYSKDKVYLEKLLFRYVYSRITILERKENYHEALDLCFSLLKHYEGANQKVRTATLFDEIGYIYFTFKNIEKALFYYQKSNELLLKTDDALGLGASYLNLYGAYAAMGDNITAIKYCYSALSCFKKIDYFPGMRASYGNLAMYYENINIDKAIANMELSLELKSDSIDMLNPGLDETTYARLLIKKARYEKNPSHKKEFLTKAEGFLERAQKIAKLLKNKTVLKEALGSLAELEKEKGNFEKAFNYSRLFANYKDSVLSDKDNNASASSMMKYEFDKKEQEQKLIAEKKEAIKQKELEKQKIQKYFFIIGFIIVSFFALFAFKSFKSKQKSHRIIFEQKSEVEKQKMIIENKQSQLLQSINYAQRIQDNLLKSETGLRNIFPDSFIIFKPRDIVSGDFYWFTKTAAGDVIVAIGDCTGHGVPGALLSMIGLTSLNEIVNHQKKYDPGDILNRLSIDVHDAFSKEDNKHKIDGMDFSVCKISPSKNKLSFAGVNQSLYYYNKATGLGKIEPQISSINGIFDISRDEKIKSEKIDLVPGTCFYLFSDGIIDQIGEKSGKKYLSKRFEESLFSDAAATDLSLQKQNILNALNDWQGGYKQIDDLTVLGFRV
jgi:serine phosphatase RsbU (regulator of sigma subunit)